MSWDAVILTGNVVILPPLWLFTAEESATSVNTKRESGESPEQYPLL